MLEYAFTTTATRQRTYAEADQPKITGTCLVTETVMKEIYRSRVIIWLYCCHYCVLNTDILLYIMFEKGKKLELNVEMMGTRILS